MPPRYCAYLPLRDSKKLRSSASWETGAGNVPALYALERRALRLSHAKPSASGTRLRRSDASSLPKLFQNGMQTVDEVIAIRHNTHSSHYSLHEDVLPAGAEHVAELSQNNAGIVFSCYTPGNEKRY